eukprot:TRINITY_DN10483_c0_g1_i1.p1 TRINITY_DN10483_c0_g1~~TRINITY_DN10483_c0_g1_i1.p1  ORF type:complete len:225 (+),score=67.60 TRINITY_DN10483_c0_g1_i1:128-802(+)
MDDFNDALLPATADDEDVSDGHDALQVLRAAWVNEKCAPELLQFESDAVEKLNELVKQQEEQAKEGATASTDNKFQFNIYAMEIERVKYLLASYLRTRMWKIEEQARYLMTQRELDDVDNPYHQLAPTEQAYCQQYHALVQGHMETCFLGQLSDNFAKVPEEAAAPADLNTHVFCKFTEAMEKLNLADEEDEDLVISSIAVDDVYILRYKAIQQLLKEGRVKLL